MTQGNNLRPVIRQFFRKAVDKYRALEKDGSIRDNIARDDDLVTRMDQAMTDVAVDFFGNREERFDLQTEERAKQEQERDVENPEYTVIMDEIDGTSNFASGSGAHGPVIGIAEGADPKFKDMVAAGFINMETNTYYEAYRGEGAFQNIEGVPDEDEEVERIHVSGRSSLGAGASLSLDRVILNATKIEAALSDYEVSDCGASAQNLARVAEGIEDAAIMGRYEKHGKVNPKTSEEIAPCYILINEAGGAVVNHQGDEIGDRKVGLRDQKNHDIVAASSRSLAEEVAEIVREVSE